MEQWERWIPISGGLPSRVYNDTFIDNKEGILLEFSDETDVKKIVVKFEEGVLSYRNTDEGSLLKKLNYLDKQYGSNFYSKWPFFKVKDSEYINWFLGECSGIYESNQVEHFVFLTPDDVIEILSTYTPYVEIK